MRTEWEHGWWESAIAEPHMSLRGAVVGPYMGWTEHTRLPIRRREVAGTIIPIIINFGAQYDVFSGADTHERGERRGSFVAGLYDTWAAVEGPADSCALQVNLTPFAARALLGVPLWSLHNETIELPTVLGRSGAALVEELGNLRHWTDRFARLDQFLRDRRVAEITPPLEVQWCWEQLASSGGRTPIAALTSYIGWSPRRLIAAFRDHVGVPPRTVSGIRRFEAVIASVMHSDPQQRVAWTSVAFECGYADQAHLIRDFNRFAGCTPTAFLRAQLPDGGGVMEAVPLS